MKKMMMGLLTGVVLILSACGSSQEKTVDLQAYWSSLQETYEWSDTDLVDVEGEMLESYYPGIGEIATRQLIAKMPMMSSVVNEMVFMECENKADAEKAMSILQDRIHTQANGGAWYPESMEAWSRGTVILYGNYVGMIVSAQYQDEISASFQALFT